MGYVHRHGAHFGRRTVGIDLGYAVTAVLVLAVVVACRRGAGESADDAGGAPRVLEPGTATPLRGPGPRDREARRPPPPMPQYRSEWQSDVPVPLAAAAGTSGPPRPTPPAESVGAGEADGGDAVTAPAPPGEIAEGASPETPDVVTGPLEAADREASDQLGRSGDLTIERFVLCENVEDREPVGPTRSFARSDHGKIWAFIHAANPGSDTRKLSVTFESIDRAGASTPPVELDIPPGPRYRTWAWATTARPAGRYRAVVRDEVGAVVALGHFEVVE